MRANPWKRLGALSVLILLAVSTHATVAATGDAAPSVPGALWSAPTQLLDSRPIVAANGDVTAESCGSAASPGAIQDLANDGTLLWSIPAANVTCLAPTVTDPNGVTYTAASDGSENGIQARDRKGQVLWSTPTAGFTGFRGAPALGWNGQVLFSLWNGAATKVLGLDEKTGAVTLDLPVGDISGLFAYADGFAVVIGSNVVDYYDYSGTLRGEFSAAPDLSNDIAFSSAAGADGSVFLAGYNGGCEVGVAEFTPAGKKWGWSDPSANSCDQTLLSATPDGGVILTAVSTTHIVHSIDANGLLRWTYVSKAPANASFVGGGTLSAVDADGVVALASSYRYVCADGSYPCYGVEVEFRTEDADTSPLPDLAITDDAVGGYEQNGLALDLGRLYLGLTTPISSGTSYVSAFDMPGIAQDYQVIVGTPGASSPPLPPPTLILNPTTSTGDVGTSQIFTASLSRGATPLPGVDVALTVAQGPCAGPVGSADTDALGNVTFQFSCPSAGTDILSATAAVDASTVSATSTINWWYLTPPAHCLDGALIGVRGSGDNSYGDDFAGRHAVEIARLLDARGIRLYDDGQANSNNLYGVIGLSYPAVSVTDPSVLGYRTSVDAGVSALRSMLQNLRDPVVGCGPNYPVLLTGFSQGAHVIQSLLEQLDDAAASDDTWESIAGVALLASPRFDHADPDARGTFVASYPLGGIAGEATVRSRFAPLTRTWCLATDPVCTFTPGNLTHVKTHTKLYNPGSKTGEPVLVDAAGLLQWDLTSRLGEDVPPSPVGNLDAFRVDPSNTVRITAAALYAEGAPTTHYHWDFTSDGVVDQTTDEPYVEFHYGVSSPLNPFAHKATALATVTIDHADGETTTRQICVRYASSGAVTC